MRHGKLYKKLLVTMVTRHTTICVILYFVRNIPICWNAHDCPINGIGIANVGVIEKDHYSFLDSLQAVETQRWYAGFHDQQGSIVTEWERDKQKEMCTSNLATEI